MIGYHLHNLHSTNVQWKIFSLAMIFSDYTFQLVWFCEVKRNGCQLKTIMISTYLFPMERYSVAISPAWLQC